MLCTVTAQGVHLTALTKYNVVGLTACRPVSAFMQEEDFAVHNRKGSTDKTAKQMLCLNAVRGKRDVTWSLRTQARYFADHTR